MFHVCVKNLDTTTPLQKKTRVMTHVENQLKMSFGYKQDKHKKLACKSNLERSDCTLDNPQRFPRSKICKGQSRIVTRQIGTTLNV